MASAEGWPATEGGGDLLEGGGEGGEALGLAALEERLCGVEEGLSGRRGCSRPGSRVDAQASGGLGEEDAGGEKGFLGDGEVTVAGLGAEAQRRPRLVAGEPGGAGRDVEERRRETSPATSAVPAEEKTPVEEPGAGGCRLGIDDLEAVEEDAGGDTGVAHVRDASARSRSPRSDSGDVGLEPVGHGAVEGVLGHERPRHEDLDVVVHDGLGVGASLEEDDEAGGLGRGGVEAVEGEGLGLAHPRAERLPLPQVLDVEDVGREDDGSSRTRRNLAKKTAGRAVGGRREEAHASPTGPSLEGVDDLGREGHGGRDAVDVEEEPAARAEGGARGRTKKGTRTRLPGEPDRVRRSAGRGIEGPGASGEDGLEGDGVKTLLGRGEEGVGVRVGSRAGSAAAERPRPVSEGSTPAKSTRTVRRRERTRAPREAS